MRWGGGRARTNVSDMVELVWFELGEGFGE